jgi:hypothetical protein
MTGTNNPGGGGLSNTPESSDGETGHAEKTLAKHGFIKKKECDNLTVGLVSTVLKRIAAKAAAINGAGATAVEESIRAVVDLLQVAGRVDEAAGPSEALLAAVSEQEGRWTKAAERLEKMTETAYGSGQDIYGEIAEKVEVLTKAVLAMESTVKETAARQNTITIPAGGLSAGEQTDPLNASGLTFAQAVAKSTPRHVDAVARVELIKRQVVLRAPEGQAAGPLNDLTEKEVLLKAQAAVEAMARGGIETAGDVKFLHARKTARGGAILVVQTASAATWLKEEGNMEIFSHKMGGALSARADLCMLVAEYVPITFEPDEMTAVEQVEVDSGLPRGTIKEARYIKNKLRRRDGQRTAHMLIGFADPEQANVAIGKGLVMEGKHVSLRRHRVDPHRCLKCQQIGVTHRAAECKSIHDTCGRCGAVHKTADCKVEDPAAFRCVNCKVTGHASVDRNCPVFLSKMKVTHARFPDYQYRFFPTHDPNTWEKEEYGLEGDWEAGQEAAGAPGPRKQDATHRRGAREQDMGAATNGHGLNTRPRDNGWPDPRRPRVNATAGPSRSAESTGAQRLNTGSLRQATLDGIFQGRNGGTQEPPEWPDNYLGGGSWGDTPEEVERSQRDRPSSYFDPSPNV